jgi:hypothetical protein
VPAAPEVLLVPPLPPPVPCDVELVVVLPLVVDAPLAALDDPVLDVPAAPPALVVDVVSPVVVSTCVERVLPTSPEHPAASAPHTISHDVQPKCKIPAECRGGTSCRVA